MTLPIFRRPSVRRALNLFLCAAVPALVLWTPLPAAAEDPGYRNQMRTARRLVARQQAEEAMAILDMVLNKHPYEARALSLYVDALLQLDRTGDALDLLSRALEQPDVDAMAMHRTRVNVHFATEDWDKALYDIARVMVLGDDLTNWGFKTTEMLIERGLDPSAGRKVLDGALDTSPGHVDLLLLHAMLTTLDGEPESALQAVTDLDRQKEEQGRLLLDYADRLVELNRRTEAKAAVQIAASEAVKPTRRSQVLFKLSDLLQEDGDYEEALVQLNTIAAEREGSGAATKALIESAGIYREFVNDCPRALEVYTRLESDPAVGHYLPKLLLDKAECLVRLEEFEAAMSTYDEVFPEALDPEQAERAAFGKASVMFFAGDPDSALTLFQDMAQTYPRSLQTDDAAQWYIMLNAYSDLGGGEAMALLGRVQWGVAVDDSAAVVAAAQQLLDGYSRSEPAAEALMVLGSLAESNRLYAQALGYYEQVVQEHAHDRRAPLALKKQGDLLVMLDRPQEALEKLERILTDYSNSIVSGEARRMVEKLRSAIKS